MKWMDILKSLPYAGGASTSRWVVLNVALVICTGNLAMTVCMCVVYLRSPDHSVNITMAALIGATQTALFAFATQTLNTKHQLTSAADASASTPLTAPAEVK